jgi:hypothetical protein
MSNFIIIAVILLSIILLSIMNIVFALKCPNCKKWFGLVWQELHQRSICKHCSWLVYDKDWQPPNKGALKTLHDLAPFKYKYERKDLRNIESAEKQISSKSSRKEVKIQIPIEDPEKMKGES